MMFKVSAPPPYHSNRSLCSPPWPAPALFLHARKKSGTRSRASAAPKLAICNGAQPGAAGVF